MDYSEYWEQMFAKGEELNALIHSYWNDYSGFGTWQFWSVVALVVMPLIILCFTVDKKRIFELFFFGYTVHLLWTYIDIAIERYGYFVHTHFLTPIYPFASNMTASVLPVSFLLLYQYCTSRNKNFYLYTLLLSAIFAFGLTTIEESLGLLEFRKGMNRFIIFLIDLGVVYFAFWFTKFILFVKDR